MRTSRAPQARMVESTLASAFLAVIDGKTVFLCWRSDERELAWYHPMEEGFQGRTPLPKTSPVEWACPDGPGSA